MLQKWKGWLNKNKIEYFEWLLNLHEENVGKNWETSSPIARLVVHGRHNGSIENNIITEQVGTTQQLTPSGIWRAVQ